MPANQSPPVVSNDENEEEEVWRQVRSIEDLTESERRELARILLEMLKNDMQIERDRFGRNV